MARQVIEVVAVAYRRAIYREEPKQDSLAFPFLPQLRTNPRRIRRDDERHFDPNTVEHPLHGRVVYAWRPNARHDNEVGEEQVQKLREIQTRLRLEAQAEEHRLFEGVTERVRVKHGGRTPEALDDFARRHKEVRGESGVTSPEFEAEAAQNRRLDFVRSIARAEISRVAVGQAPGFLGFGQDPVNLVWRHVEAEVVELMELDPQKAKKLLREALSGYYALEDVLTREVEYAKQAIDADIAVREFEAEAVYTRLKRPRGGNDAVKDRLLKANQDHGRSPRTGHRRKWCRCSFASWKGSTHCRKQWEMRPRGIR